MIEKMTRYDFILLSGEEGHFLAQLQEAGLVDITRSVKPADEPSRELASEIELLDGLIQAIRKTEIPEGIRPVSFSGEGSEDLPRLAGGTLMCLSQAQTEVQALRKQLADSQIWGSFSPAVVKELSDAGVPLHFHRVSLREYQEDWAEECVLSEIARDKTSVYFVVAGDDPLPGVIPAPQADAGETEAKLQQKEQELETLLGEVLLLKERLPELQRLRAEAYARLDLRLAGAAATPAAEDTIVTLTGYAPEEQETAVTEALERSGVFYIKDRAKASDNPPIELKNNKFVKMFEVLTDMYGRPAYDGFDPTPFIAVFFLLFFAFCMGDCGYGLVLIVIGLLLKKVDSFKSLAPLVITLGAGTAVIGFLFHTFFSIDISTWTLFAPIKGIFLPAKIAGYDGTMILSIIVGVVHICLAMVVKTYQETRNKGFLNALGTWGWTLLIVGGVAVGALALVGVLDKAVTKWIVIVLGVVSALGIFVFNDLHRNKLMNVGVGLWETYNTATGLIGDVLSYLRLYALGLAGSMLGLAFNSIGKMILGDGSNALLWIPFILIVVIGHTLNIAMAALGAFVHPLRLNFLEFFKNSGYEGSGRSYNPLKKL